jgi:hypothetical protein
MNFFSEKGATRETFGVDGIIILKLVLNISLEKIFHGVPSW